MDLAGAPARRAVRGAVRQVFADEGRRRPAAPFAMADDDDPGLFGPGSVAWRVHADRSMLIAGLRALLVQTWHPSAMAGVAQHSAYRDDPLGRLERTGRYVAATTYGTEAEAARAIAVVERVHERVQGITAAGVPYRANDPELLAWVHNVEVDSFLRAYRRYGAGAMSDAEADRYVAEMAVLGRRLGVSAAPTSVAELRDWLRGVEDLEVTAEARDAVRFLLLPPLPVAVMPAYVVIAAAAVGMLPPRLRLELRLPPRSALDPTVVRPAMRALLGVLGWALGPSPAARAAAAANSAVSAPPGA
jgi:uncharacterized protein (DUF2236 family)